MTRQARRGAGQSAPSALDFDPVPLRYRRDGWTPARQRAFILALGVCRCVLEACRHVGMSSAGAYKLYDHPGAQGFRRAWHAALATRSATKIPAGTTHWISSISSKSSTSAARLPQADGMRRKRLGGGFTGGPVL